MLMRKKIYSFCAIPVLAFLLLLFTPYKGNAQTFIGKLEGMGPSGNTNPGNFIKVDDGSTITIIVISGWGGQKQAQGFIHFASGDETRTSLLTVDRYDNNVISATNGEYLNYSVEQATIFPGDKLIGITVAGTLYSGTLTEIR